MLNLVDKMEANLHLDTNVLLPPRKRLLAGLKKQNSDSGDGFSVSRTCGPASSETDTRIEESARSILIDPNRSDEEIVEASLSALATAVKLAKDKRGVAEQKAEAAAKAIAAAKDALELVAIMSEESRRKTRCMRKNKKRDNKKNKQVSVQTLYNKERSAENLNTDEELARKLHQAMNSSPRISKNSPPSDSRRLDHGKLVCKKNEADYKFVQSGEETKHFSLYGRPPKTVIKLLMDKPFYPSGDDACTSAEKRSKIESLSICPPTINAVNLGESTPIWKCGEFKTSVCVKQDKAVESSS